MITLPMLLPTITYGFVLIYTFGTQGTLTTLLGEPIFSVYGYVGLLLGYVLYTLPIVYILMYNSMVYIDKQYLYVSNLMHDHSIRRYYHTVFHPMIGTIATGFILAFILSFTDFGIPASIGGDYDVIAMKLYRTMLGSIVSFEEGAVLALFMLMPSVFALMLMQFLKRYEIKAVEMVQADIVKGRLRDQVSGSALLMISAMIIIIFSTIVIVPFTKGYPYDLTFTFDHLIAIFQDARFISVLKNSLIVAIFTAIIGTIIAFTTALLYARTNIKGRKYFHTFSMITNAVPGMVLGIGYLFLFNNSSLKGTLIIIIISNIIHFYTTPFMMAKHALEKMDETWEMTAELLQDTWIQTIWRVIIPNSKATLISMASYYFINAMVTVSGVIFLVATDTALLSTWIKELQHFANFNEIFILSLFILLINSLMKWLMSTLAKNKNGV